MKKKYERWDNKDINPLWTNYMSNVYEEKWMKEVKLYSTFPSKSYGCYDMEEFDQLLMNDIKFNDKWGTIK